MAEIQSIDVEIQDSTNAKTTKIGEQSVTDFAKVNTHVCNIFFFNNLKKHLIRMDLV